MSTPAEAIREQLMARNEEYQRLYEEHARYAAQLEDLNSKARLTEEDKLEEVRLKKLKLRTKDRMEMIVQKARIS